MTPDSMEDYLRRRLKVELLKLDRMRALVTFPADLQGPPGSAHGGGAAALLFEMVRMVVGERGGDEVLPRPVRVAVAIHRPIPLDTPLEAHVTAGTDGWHSRILRDGQPVIEADVRPSATPLAPPPPEMIQAWESARGSAQAVPVYEFCLGCGLRNPRGAQVRFEYDEQFVWRRLSPPRHFRCGDGRLSPGYHIIVGDELGWWLGALRQGECGVSSRLVVTVGPAVAYKTPLLALGPRAAVRTDDPKGRIWRTHAVVVTSDWQPVAAAEVEFAGSRAFSKTMLPGFIAGDPTGLAQAFPRYKDLPTRP